MERAERSGGLHKRSAEDWGVPLTRAIGAEPLSEVWPLYWCASARELLGAGVAGRNGPAEMGAQDAMRLKRGKRLLPSLVKEL